MSVGRPKKNISKEELEQVLRAHPKKADAANALHISFGTLARLISEYEIESKEVEPDVLREIMAKHKLVPEEAKLTVVDLTTAGDSSTIWPFGDAHYGNKDCNYPMLEKVMRWSYKTEVDMIGMGDYIESAIIDSPGTFDQDTFVTDQVADVVAMLEPLAEEGRIIGLLDGNHERRIRTKTSLDVTDLICKMLKVKYLGFGSLFLFKVRTNGESQQTYTMYATHGDSNAKYPQTKLRACMDLQSIAEAEIYCMGHVHSLAHQKIERYVIADDGSKVVKQPTQFILTGSYLNYWGTYAHMKNMPPSGDSGSPKINLHTREHRVSVSV